MFRNYMSRSLLLKYEHRYLGERVYSSRLIV